VLIGPSQISVPTFGLIDSGADATCFPLDYARLLGIKLDKCQKETVRTAGGPAPEYIWKSEPIKAVILGRLLELEARFSDTPMPLLGQVDFFDRFKVRFDWRAKRFLVEAYD
jgi:hypothetical protein